MAEATESAETPQEAPTGDAKPEEARGLRKQLNEAHAEIKTLKVEKMDDALVKLNLNRESGLGKAIAKEYEGEASFDAISAYANTEYGHALPEASGDHPQAAQVQTAQAALDQVGQVATPTAPIGREDALAKADALGDYATTMAIKAQRLAESFN